MLNTKVVFNEMFTVLPSLRGYRKRVSQIHRFLEDLNSKCVADLFLPTSVQGVSLNPFDLVRMSGHVQRIGVNLFSQKNSWKRVDRLDHVPFSFKEGSLFTSSKEEMLWE